MTTEINVADLLRRIEFLERALGVTSFQAAAQPDPNGRAGCIGGIGRIGMPIYPPITPPNSARWTITSTPAPDWGGSPGTTGAAGV